MALTDSKATIQISASILGFRTALSEAFEVRSAMTAAQIETILNTMPLGIRFHFEQVNMPVGVMVGQAQRKLAEPELTDELVEELLHMPIEDIQEFIRQKRKQGGKS